MAVRKKTRGDQLRDAIREDVKEVGLELDPRDLAILDEAAAVADRIAQLEAAVGDNVIVSGKPHAGLVEARMQRGLLQKLLSGFGTVDPEDVSEKARKAVRPLGPGGVVRRPRKATKPDVAPLAERLGLHGDAVEFLDGILRDLGHDAAVAAVRTLTRQQASGLLLRILECQDREARGRVFDLLETVKPTQRPGEFCCEIRQGSQAVVWNCTCGVFRPERP